MGGEALSLERLTVRLGGALILDTVDLHVPPGSLTALLGPSGCGKTTLLRAIAGFAPVESGDVKIGEQSVAALPAERRQTAMVFQSYALWPHMNVGSQLAYPLKLRRVPRAERYRRVANILTRLDLEGFAKRSIASLSGGQRQRVALGRALIIDPPILLLDEPLSNLDASIRRTLRTELRQLQRQFGITTVMVTHDQEEALSMSDNVVLMRGGRIVQTATPDRLYNAPADLNTARFLGVDNIVPANAVGGCALPVAEAETRLIAFRSEHAIAKNGTSKSDSTINLTGTVLDCAYVGGRYQVHIQSGDGVLTAMSASQIAIGTSATIVVEPARIMLFEKESERLVESNNKHWEVAL